MNPVHAAIDFLLDQTKRNAQDNGTVSHAKMLQGDVKSFFDKMVPPPEPRALEFDESTGIHLEQNDTGAAGPKQKKVAETK